MRRGAHPRLPRLPPARDGVERLQRRARPGPGRPRARGPSPRPGPRARGAALGRRASATGTDGELRVRDACASRSACTVYRPAIGGLLPVYVADTYEGVRGAAASPSSPTPSSTPTSRPTSGRPGGRRARPGSTVALANHLVMGPAILARALAGSASPTPSRSTARRSSTRSSRTRRFLPYAREGLAGARGVLVGSRHTAESLWAARAGARAARRSTRLGPPGVDVARLPPARAGGGPRPGSRRWPASSARAPAEAGDVTGSAFDRDLAARGRRRRRARRGSRGPARRSSSASSSSPRASTCCSPPGRSSLARDARGAARARRLRRLRGGAASGSRRRSPPATWRPLAALVAGRARRGGRPARAAAPPARVPRRAEADPAVPGRGAPPPRR